MTFRLLVLMLALWTLLSNVPPCNSRGNRKATAMDDDVYNVILDIVQGKFKKPVKQRTRLERSAVIHHFRYKGRWNYEYADDEQPVLLLDGAKVVQKSEKSKIVSEQFHQTKGLGPRRLQQHLRSGYIGLSEPLIAKVLATSKLHQRLNVKFSNKAPVRPISSSTVMGRIQIDLVDFSAHSMSYKDKEYRYILTVMDVFSRYMWLRPITRKTSKNVALELAKIFDTFGKPGICQHDQGSEFKGKVSDLLQQLHIKQIKSSPYHPQSQGKIERSHRTLKTRMKYDLLISKNGTNWVEELHSYQTLLNNMRKKQLNWKTPHHIFFGRSADCKDHAIAKDVRRDAMEASQRENQRAIDRSIKKLKTPTYLVGDEVYVKLKIGNSKISKMKVATGKIVDTNLDKFNYKVSYSMEDKPFVKWFSVKDITGATIALQKDREIYNRGSNSEVLLPNEDLTAEQVHLYQQIDENLQTHDNFQSPTLFNPAPDGSCQFAAVSYALRDLGVFRSASTLRAEVVDYLQFNNYLGNQTDVAWSAILAGENLTDYLERMRLNSTFGDQLTLQAVAEIFNVQVLINSTIGGGATLISPSGLHAYDSEIRTIVIGHFREDQGAHYVTLRSLDSNITNIMDHSSQILTSSSSNVKVQSLSAMQQPHDNSPTESKQAIQQPFDNSQRECQPEPVMLQSTQVKFMPAIQHLDSQMDSQYTIKQLCDDNQMQCQPAIHQLLYKHEEKCLPAIRRRSTRSSQYGNQHSPVAKEQSLKMTSRKMRSQILRKMPVNVALQLPSAVPENPVVLNIPARLAPRLVKMAAETSAPLQQATLNMLPPEIWYIIIRLVVENSSLLTHQRLSLVCKMFNIFVSKLRPTLPEVYISPDVEQKLKLTTPPLALPHEVSMKKLYVICGKSSGLVLAVKQYLKGEKKIHHLHLVLLAIRAHGWFQIIRVFLKKNK